MAMPNNNQNPTETSRQVAYCENLFAPEMFATEASHFSLEHGVLTITFVSFRWDNAVTPGIQNRVVVGRLVMPIAGAQILCYGLYDYLKKLGFDPAGSPADPRKVQ